MEKKSLIAYSVVNEKKWQTATAKHASIQTILRFTLSTACITEKKKIVKKVKEDCHGCRLLAKGTVEVIIGPISNYSLFIIPAFYYIQINLFGPFKVYTQHNKKNMIKVWLGVFRCSTKSTVGIKVMYDCSAASFF